MDDPVLYIKNVILRRFRASLAQARLIKAEELPVLAAAIGQNSQEPGLEKKFRAARVRIEHVETGRIMEEDIYCVLASAYAPAIRTTYWGPDRNYSFRAEKGKLDSRGPVFQAIVDSVQPSLHWFNRYVQLVQILSQVPIESIRNPVEISRYLAQTSPEMNELRRQLYDRQLANKVRVNAQLRQALPGLQAYRNPFNSQIIELPAGYHAGWASPFGEYILVEDAAFDPNAGAEPYWRRLEAAAQTAGR
jgi:hypothetical protein